MIFLTVILLKIRMATQYPELALCIRRVIAVEKLYEHGNKIDAMRLEKQQIDDFESDPMNKLTESCVKRGKKLCHSMYTNKCCCRGASCWHAHTRSDFCPAVCHHKNCSKMYTSENPCQYSHMINGHQETGDDVLERIGLKNVIPLNTIDPLPHSPTPEVEKISQNEWAKVVSELMVDDKISKWLNMCIEKQITSKLV